MAGPVTLFTGQWADLPLTELAPRAREMGFDGLELACWGDHLDVARGARDQAYCDAQKKILSDKWVYNCSRFPTIWRARRFRTELTSATKRFCPITFGATATRTA